MGTIQFHDYGELYAWDGMVAIMGGTNAFIYIYCGVSLAAQPPPGARWIFSLVALVTWIFSRL